ncbi:MAG TPA: hypothetical protein VF510_15795 [Ktedonobacterales bacterium]
MSDIQGRLGHTLLAVTGRFLARLDGSKNRHLGEISGFYGLPVAADKENKANDGVHPTVTCSNT